MVCLSLTIHLRRLGAVMLGCRRRAAWPWSRRKPGRSSATRRHRRPDGTPAASACPQERARAVNSGQPWHLPYRLWLTIRLGPVPPSPADSASQARGGPRWCRDRAVNDRNGADNHGKSQPSSVQLSSPPRPSTAGHGHQPIRSDTEEVTGSNLVAPTSQNRSQSIVGVPSAALLSFPAEPRPHYPPPRGPADAVRQMASNSVHKRGASACCCFHQRMASAHAASVP
jgi:hypothetical protein